MILENLDNIDNVEGCGLTIVSYKKSAVSVNHVQYMAEKPLYYIANCTDLTIWITDTKLSVSQIADIADVPIFHFKIYFSNKKLSLLSSHKFSFQNKKEMKK